MDDLFVIIHKSWKKNNDPDQKPILPAFTSTWSTISDTKLLPCSSFRVSGLLWFLGEVVGGRKNVLASVIVISTVHQLSIFCGHAGIVLPGPHAVG